MAQLLILVILVGLLAWARKSKPAGNKSGNSFLSLENSNYEPEFLKVASYNIQTGKNLNGKRYLLGSAKVMSQADLVGVQEVYAPSLMNLLGFGDSQTETIAKNGGFGWLFNATRRRWLREHRGNAILSKLPILQWETKMLTDQDGKSFRNMTIAEVSWQKKRFHFINTHLHTRGGRETQLIEVMQEFAKYPRAILVGDFNSRVTTPTLEQALKDIEISDAVRLANLDTDNSDRIDWILCKGFNIQGGKIVEKGVSDHPYYQVNLTYKD